VAKLNEQFNAFLSNINPKKCAVGYAQEAHKPIRECLEAQDDFKEFVEKTFLYGSYKRRTAVGDIKDVDIVVLTNFDLADEENTPKSVLRRLKAALGRCYNDPETLNTSADQLELMIRCHNTKTSL
jgi:tRNA nucleotidyltransferase (CCA-adding enzyme)